MVYALAAASAINLLSSLKPSSSSAARTNAPQPFDVPLKQAPAIHASSQSSGSGALSPETQSELLAAQSQDSGQSQAPHGRAAALKDLFSRLDNDNDGQISKAEFETNLGAGDTNVQAADSVFAKLDKDGSGSVSESELLSALQGPGRHGRHHGLGHAGGPPDALLQALNGATSTPGSNGDRSPTSTITYGHGSKVTAKSAVTSYNFIERAIQGQTGALASSASQAFSVSA